jgi:hypothetical protein
MGVLCTHSPQMPRTSKYKNKSKIKKFGNSQAAVGQARGRRATAGRPPASDQQSKTGWPRLTSSRTLVARWWATSSRRPMVAHRPWACPILFFMPPHFSSCLPFFFLLLPPTFGHFGQLHLIGYSTCPPCPEFA